uniref:Uncharacterized protein n=1 Tax=Arundo donax TaxID=35708 RepID=A0A0A9C065_ARUDO
MAFSCVGPGVFGKTLRPGCPICHLKFTPSVKVKCGQPLFTWTY